MRPRVLVILLSVGILLALWSTGVTINRLREGSLYVKDHWTGRNYECDSKGCRRLYFVRISTETLPFAAPT